MARGHEGREGTREEEKEEDREGGPAQEQGEKDGEYVVIEMLKASRRQSVRARALSLTPLPVFRARLCEPAEQIKAVPVSRTITAITALQQSASPTCFLLSL